MRIVLIPCMPSDWQSEGRLLGRVELSPAGNAEAAAAPWLEQLAAWGVQRIIHAPDELAAKMAGAVRKRVGGSARPLAALDEVDIGLWAGLTEAQLKARYPTAYRQLRESPLNVHPPHGEDVRAAAERLRACVRRQIRKNGVAVMGVVARPLALALLKCELDGTDVRTLWDVAQELRGPVAIDTAVAV